jgi:hypothetical protein
VHEVQAVEPEFGAAVPGSHAKHTTPPVDAK